jgi:hypothetical protein
MKLVPWLRILIIIIIINGRNKLALQTSSDKPGSDQHLMSSIDWNLVKVGGLFFIKTWLSYMIEYDNGSNLVVSMTVLKATQ